VRSFFGYIRVSTAKQGERGVSLQEQRDAITRYAERNNLAIAAWFEERETAAKRGRPVFNEMLKLLRRGKADGVVIHKIDRSARNLKDWSDLGELIDHGVEVYFTNESLDLQSRGGRLSADIQAVVAADYIRNLREETRKGFYGRLKQGLYPLPAPLGYLDKGKGNLKELDSDKAPLVRKAFELYGTARYSLNSLVEEMFRLGLRNRASGKVTRNGFSVLLNNPFYIGLIKLRRTGEMFAGSHEPLISKSLFDRVQDVLTGKTNARTQHHDFLFRRLLVCERCKHSLTGEGQKGHIYYRCHTRGCPLTSIREDEVEEQVCCTLAQLVFSDKEKAYIEQKITKLKEEWTRDEELVTNNLRLGLSNIQSRLARLTDAYLDGMIEKELFEDRKAGLLLERKEFEEKQAQLRAEDRSVPERVAEFFELAGSAYLLYQSAFQVEKRDLLKIVTSNRQVEGKKLYLTVSFPFSEVENRAKNTNGVPHRDRLRTLEKSFHVISNYFKSNPAPMFGEHSKPE